MNSSSKETLDSSGENQTQSPDTPAPEAEILTDLMAPGPDMQTGLSDLSVEQLQTLLDETRTALAEAKDEALRARAEMENLRRRTIRDVENAHKFGIERLVGELLPVIDSLELGLQAADAQEGATVEALREGSELTLKMMLGALEKSQLQVVNPVDESFNPEFHQAMSMQPSEEKASGTVMQVFQKGYTLSGRLVRPAMVIVAQ